MSNQKQCSLPVYRRTLLRGALVFSIPVRQGAKMNLTAVYSHTHAHAHTAELLFSAIRLLLFFSEYFNINIFQQKYFYFCHLCV